MGTGLINVDVGSVVSSLGGILEHIFPNAQDRANAQAVLNQIGQHPNDLQVEVNKIEAASQSIFIAGWRPFIGWVCGVSLLYEFIAQPLLTGFGLPAPMLDGGALGGLVTSMLGMAGFRTVEKIQGAAGNH